MTTREPVRCRQWLGRGGIDTSTLLQSRRDNQKQNSSMRVSNRPRGEGSASWRPFLVQLVFCAAIGSSGCSTVQTTPALDPGGDPGAVGIDEVEPVALTERELAALKGAAVHDQDRVRVLYAYSSEESLERLKARLQELDGSSDRDPLADLVSEINLKYGGASFSADANLWDRIRAGYGIGQHRNPRIDREVQAFARRPDYLERSAQRAEAFLHMIVEEIQRRGLPTEIALLPIIESAYQATAYSPAHAAGIWQFIPTTGQRYGLKQNWWYDGRRDVYASTRAALDYLTKLNKDFNGDWLLAFAAYNCGEQRVQQEVDRNRAAGRPTDFWNLRLPSETQKYVPKLLAVARIVAHPKAYGVSLKPIPNRPQVTLVKTGGQMDLKVAARLANMADADLMRLNPGFKRGSTDPSGPHHLLLPKDKAKTFELKVAALPKDDRLRWHRHRVRAGETLTTIAARYNTDADTIRKVNKIDGNLLIAGNFISIPASAEAPEQLAAASAPSAPKVKPVAAAPRQTRVAQIQKTQHTVRAGETLWKIAQRYGVSTSQLAAWNGMSTQDTIRVGQNLLIVTGDQRQTHLASASPDSKKATRQVQRRVIYKVRKGDSLYGIARRFNVSIDDIKRWNQLRSERHLQAGQQLVLLLDVKGQGAV